MPIITINGTSISFPDTAKSPDWSQGIIEFAQAVEQGLSGLLGAADVTPQSYDISSFNPGTPNSNLPNLAFSTAITRSSVITYAIYRTADSPTTVAVETGNLQIVYDTSAGSWLMTQERTGDGQVAFNITNDGQIQFTCTQIGSVNHAGRIIYEAKSLLQA